MERSSLSGNFWPEDGINQGRERFRSRDVIKNITFEAGDKGSYVNKDRAGKIIILDRNSVNPMVTAIIERGGSLDVEVLRDTKPDQSRGGAILVKFAQLSKMPDDPEAGKAPPPEGAIEIDEERGVVHILDSVVPLNPDLDPARTAYARSRFEGSYTLDKRTVGAIQTIGEAFATGQPCLLEGETAVSKTSAIEFVAAQTGYEVARLNLNGQSDTSELVGKFVPNDEGAQLKFEELLHNFEILSPASQEILTRVKEEGRALTHLEAQKIATNENLRVSDWVWKNGLVVEAMIKGKVLILDEGNLAEAQVLERLNSVLENPGSVTLTENGGLVVRKLSDEEMKQYESGELRGVAPLHPNFRIFMTMNPAEYQGRSVMSPAFKDRWPLYHYVERPSESDYQDMLVHQVYGTQPEFVHEGTKYGGEQTETNFKRLSSKESGFAEEIPRLAKFHVKMEEMARNKAIGRSRREPYIFTRRGLIELVKYLEQKQYMDRKTGEVTTYQDVPDRIFKEAIHRFYINNMVDDDDRKKVADTLRAIGFTGF